MFAGSTLGTWAMIANRFFSSHVRIQTERGHEVVSSGPYRFVRHPGYAGNVLAWIVSPVFFSSTWAAIPAILAAKKYHNLFHNEMKEKEYDRRLLDAFGNRFAPGSLIGDAGCGPSAHIGRYLFDKGMKVIGIDISDRPGHSSWRR